MPASDPVWYFHLIQIDRKSIIKNLQQWSERFLILSPRPLRTFTRIRSSLTYLCEWSRNFLTSVATGAESASSQAPLLRILFAVKLNEKRPFLQAADVHTHPDLFISMIGAINSLKFDICKQLPLSLFVDKEALTLAKLKFTKKIIKPSCIAHKTIKKSDCISKGESNFNLAFSKKGQMSRGPDCLWSCLHY